MKAFILFFALLISASAAAQSCTSATCNAASCSESAVLAAMPSSSTTQSTVTVNIPAGTCSWTTHLTYTVPSAVTNLTIQGGTVITWSGTAGTSNWFPTVNGPGSQTILTDGVASNDYFWSITTGAANTYVTISGISWTSLSGSQYNKYSNGFIHITGASQNVRFGPSNYINNSTGQLQNEWVQLDNQGGACPTGVADHNYFNQTANNTLGDNGIRVMCAPDDNIGFGDGAWFNGPKFGTFTPFYIESSYFLGGASNDCANGARFVERYDTFDTMYVPIQAHGTKTSAGGGRGCNSYEAYYNYFTGPSATPSDGAVGAKGGTALIWGNILPQGYYRFYAASTDRSGGDSSANEINPPNGWGYCGTAVTIPSTQTPPFSGTGGTPNGVGSNWDGNQAGGGTPTSIGYPCIDNLGRGQDTQALNGQYFTTGAGRLNTVTNSIAWPHQYLQPIYLFDNPGVVPQAATFVAIRDNSTTIGLDVLFDCGTYNSACSRGFTGAFGTGYGLLANRPVACTAGPGGTYGTSATGSEGVLYWATDACSGNGQAYVCTTSGNPGTWTAIYPTSPTCGPAVYPHPLVSGGGGVNFNWTPTVSPPGSGTITGPNCASGSYLSGTLVGACTPNPATGWIFSSWSGVTGSATCSGSTSPCPQFALTSSSTATANFTQLTTATPTFSPAAGSYATPQLVTISDATAGASIYWTGDGSTPTTSSALYTGPILVNGSAVLHNDGNFQNDISGWNAYTSPAQTGGVNAPASTVFVTGASPTISGNGSLEISETTIATSTQTNFLVVNNTLGGCDTCTYPNEDFQIYIPSATYSNATSYEMDMLNSNVTTNFLYMFGLQCNLSTHNWQYANETSAWTDTGANCTTPLTANAWHHIQIQDHWVMGDTSCTGGVPTEHFDWIAVDGVRTNWNLTICATTKPAGWGSIIANQFQIDIGATSGTAKTATIYLDEGSLTGSNGVGFPTTTLRAIAAASGYLNSNVGSAAYTINGAASAPTFAPPAGTYSSAQNVTTSTTTSACNNSSYLYTGTANPPTGAGNTITVSSSETVYSYVHNCPGWLDSPVSSAAYVITVPPAPVVFGGIETTGTCIGGICP